VHAEGTSVFVIVSVEGEDALIESVDETSPGRFPFHCKLSRLVQGGVGAALRISGAGQVGNQGAPGITIPGACSVLDSAADRDSLPPLGRPPALRSDVITRGENRTP
jgi:hypothetical protein